MNNKKWKGFRIQKQGLSEVLMPLGMRKERKLKRRLEILTIRTTFAPDTRL